MMRIRAKLLGNRFGGAKLDFSTWSVEGLVSAVASPLPAPILTPISRIRALDVALVYRWARVLGACGRCIANSQT